MKLYCLILILYISNCKLDQITPKVTTHVFWQYLRYGNGNIEDYAFREVNKSSVTFQIKTRTTNYTDIHVNNLTNLPIIPNRPYKVIIHGYNSNSTIPFVINATKEYLKKDNFNVITVDWSPLAFDDYPVSTGYLYGIGKHTGNLLIALNRTFNIPFEKFHLVGVSLGAQLAGFVGSHVQNETGHSVGRISGVDPGGALFNRAPNRSRLDRSDALFVDVMHTDWGIIGARYMAGHVDFFPDNGVAAQPYCRTTLSFITKHFSVCSHVIAQKYFVESINSNNFVASKCDKHKVWSFISLSNYTSYVRGYCKNYPTALMGENCDKTASGQYYLTVNPAYPFAKG